MPREMRGVAQGHTLESREVIAVLRVQVAADGTMGMAAVGKVLAARGSLMRDLVAPVTVEAGVAAQ